MGKQRRMITLSQFKIYLVVSGQGRHHLSALRDGVKEKPGQAASPPCVLPHKAR